MRSEPLSGRKVIGFLFAEVNERFEYTYYPANADPSLSLLSLLNAAKTEYGRSQGAWLDR